MIKLFRAGRMSEVDPWAEKPITSHEHFEYVQLYRTAAR
jgi:hypothetical protein